MPTLMPSMMSTTDASDDSSWSEDDSDSVDDVDGTSTTEAIQRPLRQSQRIRSAVTVDVDDELFETTIQSLLQLEGDLDANNFAAVLHEDDYESVGGETRTGEGTADIPRRLEVSLSTVQLVSLWAFVIIIMACVTACCWLQSKNMQSAGRYQ